MLPLLHTTWELALSQYSTDEPGAIDAGAEEGVASPSALCVTLGKSLALTASSSHPPKLGKGNDHIPSVQIARKWEALEANACCKIYSMSRFPVGWLLI